MSESAPPEILKFTSYDIAKMRILRICHGGGGLFEGATQQNAILTKDFK